MTKFSGRSGDPSNSRQWANCRVAFMLCLSMLLAACGNAAKPTMTAEEACRTLIEKTERYPSTISILKVASDRRAVAKEDMLRAASNTSEFLHNDFELVRRHILPDSPGPGAFGEFMTNNPLGFPGIDDPAQEKLFDIVVSGIHHSPNPGYEIVRVSYDVDNGRGVPERKSQSCRFFLKDAGAGTPLFDPAQAVELELARQHRFPHSAPDCCAPTFWAHSQWGIITADSFRQRTGMEEQFYRERRQQERDAALR